MPTPETFDDLVAIMDRLRGRGGCPWDREQTYETLRRYLIEECYEVADALDHRDLPGLREELGDLLLQVVFLSRLAQEDGAFTVSDVIAGISQKLVRRHPHVFSDDPARTSAQVLKRWEEIKREERETNGASEDASVLDGIPRSLPAVMKAQQTGDRVARVGFEWEREAEIIDKVEEELAELREAVAIGDATRIEDELGDLLFTTVMLARRLGVDAEASLEKSNHKFHARFRCVEGAVRSRGGTVDSTGAEQLERLWDECKRAE